MIHLTLRGLHPATHPRTSGPFVFNEAHGVHLYSGRPLTAQEFNAFASGSEWARMIDLHGERLQIRVVDEEQDKAKVAPAKGKKDKV